MQSASASPEFVEAARAERERINEWIAEAVAYRDTLDELLDDTEAPASPPAPERRGTSPGSAKPAPASQPTYRDQQRSNSVAAREERRRQVRQLIADAGPNGITQAHIAHALTLLSQQVKVVAERLMSDGLVVRAGERQGPKPGPPSPVFYDIAYARDAGDAIAGTTKPDRPSAHAMPVQVLLAIHEAGEAQLVGDLADRLGVPPASVAHELQVMARGQRPLVTKTFNTWALTKAGFDQLDEIGALPAGEGPLASLMEELNA